MPYKQPAYAFINDYVFINERNSKMLKTILIVVVLVFAAILIFAATRPDTFRIQRSTSIQAPPEQIFPLINDLHSMQTWSAWEKVDPAMKRTYSGADSGQGAMYAWEGNKDIGQGSMEITESIPPAKVTMRLDFIKPFAAHNMVEFTLEPDGDGTTVTQSMYGASPYISKLLGIFCSMDSMVGPKFEEGLANLKSIAEK